MYDVQRETTTGNTHNSSTNVTFTVTVPAGRVPINGQFECTSGLTTGGGHLLSSYRSAADTWTFKFGENSSGVARVYSLHVDHVPALDTVEVLRVP
jgi:hypothetical protein